MEFKSIEQAAHVARPKRDAKGPAEDSFVEFFNFFGLQHEMGAGPQGFRVRLPKNGVGDAHYHDIDQFQIFFGVPGSVFGRHAIPPVLVHYSDAYAPYGPFSCGLDRLEFYTLRAKATLTTGYMSEERGRKPHRKPSRNVHSEVHFKDVPAGTACMEELFSGEEDSMGAWVVNAGARAEFTGPSPAGTGGQYYCVIGGSLDWRGRRFSSKSLAWVAPDEPVPAFQCGEDGVQIILTQFPLAKP